jgi:hypothetical protein
VIRRWLWLALAVAGAALAFWTWHGVIVRRYGPGSTIEHLFADGELLETGLLAAALAIAAGLIVWIVRTGKLR